MKITNRHALIDLLRGMSILYIVTFWHLFEYTSVWPGYYNPVTLRVTVIVLGLFVFQSGWLLGQIAIAPSWEGVERFYIKRLVRIYPLYLGAIGLFALCHLADRTTLGKAALLMSMFSGPTPPTLWFITMLIAFYGVTPFLICAAHSETRFWAWAALIFGSFLLLSSLLPGIDPRLVIYFPAFACGIYLSRFGLRQLPSLLVAACLGCVCSVVLSCSTINDPEYSFWSLPLACVGPLFIFLVSWHYKDSIPHSEWLATLGYASFVMYLIHRPVYVTMKSLYFPSTGLFQWLYLIGVCVPLTIVVSWMIQKAYDAVLRLPPNGIRWDWSGRGLEKAKRV